MKVSAIQMNMKFADPDYNFAHAEQLVRKAAAAGPDVIVLPETWNTGFFPKENLTALCDHNGERVKAVLGGLAAELKVNIVAGSVSNVKDGKVYNTCYVFDRTGHCVAEYDKTHLFTPMGEHNYYQKGSHIAVFELDGKKCGVIICYDVRFLELVRTMALPGLDILFIPAQWPALRKFHWDTLTAARAIENQIFVVACNSCGSAGDTVYGGSSHIYDPWGNTLAAAGEGETIISADLDFSVIEGIRQSINVYRDRRPELYHI
ncbi:MAG: carbon-nitrogen family hydrolase [Subdoligranulum sp.]|nr:carbon-nitrogen family hydrolase [Subdoligranulum sp.]